MYKSFIGGAEIVSILNPDVIVDKNGSNEKQPREWASEQTQNIAKMWQK